MNLTRYITGGAVLVALASVLIAPAATAQASAVHVAGGVDVPSVGQYHPPSVFGGGDKEFAEHGPDIETSATLRFGIGSPRNIHVELCMFAEETREDHSRFGGCQIFLLFQAPAGECIDTVETGTIDELKYTDIDTALETFTGQVFDSFVNRWEVTGDTPGDDLGETGAKVSTNRFVVNTVSGDQCPVDADQKRVQSDVKLPVKRMPAVNDFFPKHRSGDRDFAGHGPAVVATATLKGEGVSRRLTVEICMEAKETEDDFTRADSCQTYLLYQAPPGLCIGILSHGATDQLVYTDTNHVEDDFSRAGSPNFVSHWQAMGDTVGDESGDRTGVNIEMFPVSFTTGFGGCM